MSLTRIKTVDLCGPALRWALAQAFGYDIRVQVRKGSSRVSYYAVGVNYGYIWIDYQKEISNQYGWCPDKDWILIGGYIRPMRISISHPLKMGYAVVTCGQNKTEFASGNLMVDVCRSIINNLSGDEVLVPTELVVLK